MKKIIFFIRSLNAGGAERQLVVAAKGLAERGYDVTVLTFYAGGFYADELLNTQVQLLSLDKKGRWDLLPFLWRLRRVLCEQAPDIIYSFMGVSNSLAVMMRYFIASVRIVWGVRASNMDLDQYDWLSRWSYKLECSLSRFADSIIANSNAGKYYAVAHGFPKGKMKVIPNGIDTERFYPAKSEGIALRQAWGVAENERLIGVVGRIDPMKGIPIFLDAAVHIKQQHSQVRLVWVGSGEAKYEKEMRQLATQLGLDDVLIWAGRHTDMLAIYNALDIASSSSYGEGFPNVIGEAMACGVPCVVTDVGDSALLVGDAGVVVPAKDSRTLAEGWNKMLGLDDVMLQNQVVSVRNRVVNEFDVAKLLERTAVELLKDDN